MTTLPPAQSEPDASACAEVQGSELFAGIVPPPLPGPKNPLHPSMTVYRSEARAFTFGEWSRVLPGPKMLVGWAVKILKLDFLSKGRVAHIPDYRVLEATEAELPAAALQALAPLMGEFEALGFIDPRYFYFLNPLAETESAGVQLVHPEHGIVARVLWSLVKNVASAKPTVAPSLISRSMEGRIYVTGSKLPTFEQAAIVKFGVARRPGIKAMFDTHLETLEAARASRTTVLTQDAEAGYEVVNAYEEICFQHAIVVGRYVPLNSDESAADNSRLRAGMAAGGAIADSRIASAARSMETMRTKKSSAWGKVVILAITVGLFYLTGVRQWSLQSAGVICAILFFHELGHFVAMKAFRYRNVNMFFIPMFGAAVSGRHFNIPGWKRAIVSLAGPLPGLFLSVALAAVAVMQGQGTLAWGALLLASLNALNLLPTPPLDGGAFWNTVLFSRHRWMEAVFKLLSAAALVGLSFISGSMVFVGLAVATCVSLPMVLMLGRVVNRLKAQNVSGASGDNDEIPEGTAVAILTEIDGETKKKLPISRLATLGLSAFEQLNARPPNFGQTAGLVVLYLLGWGAVVATLMIIGIGVANNTAFGDSLMGVVGRRPQHHLAPTAGQEPAPTVPVTLKTPWPLAVADRSVIMARQAAPAGLGARQLFARFPSAEAAQAALSSVGALLDPADEALRLGQTVIVSIPVRGSEDQAASRLSGISATFAGAHPVEIVDSGEVNEGVRFDLQWKLPLASTVRFREELSVWLSVPPDLRPEAPWRLAEPNRTQIRRASRTYALARDAEMKVITNSLAKMQFNSLPQLLLQKFTQRNGAEASRERRQKQRDEIRQAIQALLDQHDPSMDERILNAFIARLSSPLPAAGASPLPGAEEWTRQLEAALQIPPQPDGSPRDRPLIEFARVSATGPVMGLSEMTWPHPARDLPIFLDYLAANGATDFAFGWEKPADK